MDQDPPRDASAATDTASWLRIMEEIGEGSGYFQPLGDRHWAIFADDSATLLVTFDMLADLRARPGQISSGQRIAQDRGWSHLGLIADGPTWFRDPAVHAFFDRLVDDAFFEDFDRVVFHGSDMGAYAACAFSVTAPEATVIAVQARATLDPTRAGWDLRHRAQRRLDFTTRYGFAPDMVEGAGGVFLIFDPHSPADAAHAAMFDRPNVTFLHCRNGGTALAPMLEETGIIPRLLEQAAEGRMCSPFFARLWRKRRQHAPYLHRLLALNREKPGRAQTVFDAIRMLGGS